MNINKSSWHFKLLDYWDFKVSYKLRRNQPVTLCQYFWNVIGSILITLGMTTMGLFFVGALLGLTIGAIIGLVIFFGASWLPVIEYGSTLDVMSTIGLVVYLLFGVLYTFEVAKEQVREGKIIPSWMKFSKQEVSKPKKETKPNILFEYVKAKKNKFCPVVKLED